MQFWILLGILGLAELFVFARIRAALFGAGAVPLNPAGWFGYSEYLDVTVERTQASPGDLLADRPDADGRVADG